MDTPATDRTPPRVLIVDDTKLIREMGREALEAVGLQIIEAADGDAALREYSRSQPDLVVLDVNMPRRDGFSVCEQIRRTRGGENVPILMLTSSDDVDSIRRAYEVGATDFSAKPVNWEILSQRVRYMLRMSGVIVDLQKSQERLAKAQRTARLGYWELDPRTGRLDCSSELSELYGLGPNDVLASYEDFSAVIHPEDRALVQNAVDRASSDGSALNIDHRVKLPNAEQRTIHLHADAIPNELGPPFELSGTAQDVTERIRAEEEIRFLAYHDSLTRLGNRRLFIERLNYALLQARRHKTVVGVLFLDLDHFKRINDTLGHSIGDLFLKRVAERLRNCVRETDCVSRALNTDSDPTVSRVGGDEFMISLCSIRDAAEAAQVAARILEVLARPFQLEGHDLVVTASIGVALSPDNGDDVDILIRNADVAMYHAKKSGRGTYQFYEQSMNEVAQQNLRLESDFRGALERGELLVHYQAKIELGTRRITGFEALARWHHPELGMVPPTTFVPLAERAGMIIQMGEFVLRSACAQMKEWRESGFQPLRVSVNLSAHQFRTDEIADTVVRVLKETPMSPRCLDLELTESAMMQNQAVTVSVLQKLKGIGITVSLDDFGTGYSSLSYLKRFPVDTVKIDRSFIRDLETDPDDAAITAAIISMAKTLNLKVVAEGVETEQQLAFLREHGCEEMQGFLYSRPLPPEQATALLRESFRPEPTGTSD